MIEILQGSTVTEFGHCSLFTTGLLNFSDLSKNPDALDPYYHDVDVADGTQFYFVSKSCVAGTLISEVCHCVADEKSVEIYANGKYSVTGGFKVLSVVDTSGDGNYTYNPNSFYGSNN